MININTPDTSNILIPTQNTSKQNTPKQNTPKQNTPKQNNPILNGKVLRKVSKLPTPKQNNKLLPFNENENIEDERDLLHYWKTFAKRYSSLHAQSSNYYKKINYMIMFPVIVLTVGGGFLNIIFADNCSAVIYILLGTLQLIVAFFTGIYNYMKIPELQESHYFYYVHFLKLENDINVQLLIGEGKYKEFKNLYIYVIYVKEELNRLIDSAPSIPESIILKYNKVITEEDKFLENKTKIIKTKRYIRNISTYNFDENDQKNDTFNNLNTNSIIETDKNKIFNDLNSVSQDNYVNEIINETSNYAGSRTNADDNDNIRDTRYSSISDNGENKIRIESVLDDNHEINVKVDLESNNTKKIKLEDIELITNLEKQKRELQKSVMSIIRM
jgi:hypothetical protein